MANKINRGVPSVSSIMFNSYAHLTYVPLTDIDINLLAKG